jgi:hypothetical protein
LVLPKSLNKGAFPFRPKIVTSGMTTVKAKMPR